MAETPDVETRLVAQIEAAFASISLPPGEPIVELDVFDQDPERQEIRDFFAGRNWRNLSPAEAKYYEMAPVIFSPGPFRYFLPGFMIAAVLDTKTADTAFQVLTHMLTPSCYSDPDEFRRRVTGLTKSQRHAIRQFLLWQRDVWNYIDAVIALDGYWAAEQ